MHSTMYGCILYIRCCEQERVRQCTVFHDDTSTINLLIKCYNANQHNISKITLKWCLARKLRLSVAKESSSKLHKVVPLPTIHRPSSILTTTTTVATAIANVQLVALRGCISFGGV